MARSRKITATFEEIHPTLMHIADARCYSISLKALQAVRALTVKKMPYNKAVAIVRKSGIFVPDLTKAEFNHAEIRTKVRPSALTILTK